MITRLLEELKKWLPRKGAAFDPATLDDPVALKTAWTPAKGGGANFRTHALRLGSDSRCAFRPSFGFVLFCAVFLLMGLVIDVIVTVVMIRKAGSFLSPEWLVPVAMGSLFGAVGALLFAFSARPVVFDKQLGLAWKGWRDIAPSFERGLEVKGVLCRLDDVHAIQIVSEWIRGNKSSYTSYELNLVMEDGSRINAVDHGDIKQIRLDAAALGEFLEVSVWDATLPGDLRP